MYSNIKQSLMMCVIYYGFTVVPLFTYIAQLSAKGTGLKVIQISGETQTLLPKVSLSCTYIHAFLISFIFM